MDSDTPPSRELVHAIRADLDFLATESSLPDFLETFCLPSESTPQSSTVEARERVTKTPRRRRRKSAPQPSPSDELPIIDDSYINYNCTSEQEDIYHSDFSDHYPDYCLFD